jgi:hypothetical protein
MNKSYNCVVSSELVRDIAFYNSYSSIDALRVRIAKESGFDIIFHVDRFDKAFDEVDLKFKPDGSILANFGGRSDFMLCHESEEHKFNPRWAVEHDGVE